MIKALIFDFGGVLMRTEDQLARRKWEARLGLAENELATLVFGNPVSALASVGKAQTEAIWQHVAGQLQLGPDDLAQLRHDFWTGDILDKELAAFVAGRRGKQRTALLSNAWPDARTWFSVHPEIVAAFEMMVISGEEGVAKPDPEIYRRTLERLNVAPAEAVFVDDFVENVEAARALGIHAVQFLNRAQAIRDVEELLQ